MKRITPFIISAVVLAGPVHAQNDYEPDQIKLSKPPASIAQWYQPQNQRQVWLHTMFRLRREFQAIGDYAALEDNAGLIKWSERLVKDYKSIAEMVPEWSDEIDSKWADNLLKAARQGDYAAVAKAQRELGKTCNSCHNEYRAVTAALYRTPGYEDIQVEIEETMEELSYDKLMQSLSREMNRLIIALDDGHTEKARQSSENLSTGLKDLGSSCSNCHQDDYPRERILGEQNQKLLTDLTAGIGSVTVNDSQKLLGEAAVEICARCHAIHRTANDLVQKMKK